MPNGKGTETLSANASEDLAKSISDLAYQCGLSRSKYMLALLEDAAKRRRRFVLRSGNFVEEASTENYRLNEKNPLPPVRAPGLRR